MDHKTESAYSPNRRPLSAPRTDQPSRHAIPPSPAASNAPTKPCLWGPPNPSTSSLLSLPVSKVEELTKLGAAFTVTTDEGQCKGRVQIIYM